jgi:hypothetical protein
MTQATERAEMCILGGGIAGLNALFVATRYLQAGARVVLVDRHGRCGGMWNDTYPYVRLHQPHEMFAVGNLPWKLGKPREYLATRDEVLAYFDRCLAELRRRVDLVELWGHEVVSVSEKGAVARIAVRPAGGGPERSFEAPRCVRAFGHNVAPQPPLALSSRQVMSVTPETLFGADGQLPGDPAAPVVVVGGGKTGMDTALEVLRRGTGRPVDLLVGGGTYFARRETFFPTGRGSWRSGSTLLAAFAEGNERFDGTNEEEACARFRRDYGVALGEDYRHFFYGLLSDAENDTIRAEARSVRTERLADVEDGAGGPELVLASGDRVPVPAGTVVVNCTGYVLRGQSGYAPFLSPGGTTLTVGTTSAVHFLSSVASYFLTHLFLSGKLRDAPLYEMDLEAGMKAGRELLHQASLVLSLYNLLVFMRTLPMRVMLECGLDMDLWHPMPRRILALVRLRAGEGRRMARARTSLDRIAERTGIVCRLRQAA